MNNLQIVWLIQQYFNWCSLHCMFCLSSCLSDRLIEGQSQFFYRSRGMQCASHHLHEAPKCLRSSLRWRKSHRTASSHRHSRAPNRCSDRHQLICLCALPLQLAGNFQCRGLSWKVGRGSHRALWFLPISWHAWQLHQPAFSTLPTLWIPLLAFQRQLQLLPPAFSPPLFCLRE